MCLHFSYFISIEVIRLPVPTTDAAAAPTSMEVHVYSSHIVIASSAAIISSSVATTPINRETSNAHIVMASSTVSGSTSVAADDIVQTPTAIPLSESVTVPASESILQPSSNLHAIIQTSLQSNTETPVTVSVPPAQSSTPNTSQSVTQPDNPESGSSQPSSSTGIIAGAVAGILLTAFVISVVIVAIIIIVRKQRKVSGKQLKEFENTLDNPLYAGVISGSEHRPTINGHLEAANDASPQYELLAQYEAQPYEIPSKVDIYATLSSEATLTSRSFGKDTLDTAKVCF